MFFAPTHSPLIAKLLLLWFSLAVGGTPNPASAQSVKLTLTGLSSEGVRLQAQTSTPGPLSLEGSFDLTEWFLIQSASAVNGAAQLLHSNSLPARMLFYRARLGPPPEPVRIAPQIDPNQSASALLSPESGGRLSLATTDGVHFEFSAPTNSVREPVAIRMTVITNFTSFPANDGFRVAVSFEPEGLDFYETARLTITFPFDIPREDMAAYSFDGDGDGFHLISARPAARQMVLAVNHFSGKGVASFRNSAPPTFDKAWTRQRDARYAAEDRHARRSREIYRDLYTGKISEQTAQTRLENSEANEMGEIFRNGVQPYLKSAETDCAIGRAIVVPELERLIAQASRFAGVPLGPNDFLYEDLRNIMPKVRCACAREIIRRCEEVPGSSGASLLNALNDLLLDARLITGRTDAQGCELGSDDQIRTRLMSGPCFGEWEGSIVLERVTSTIGTGQSNSRTQTWDDERRELYTATVKRIARHTTFTSGGKPGEGWTLETEGPFHIGIRVNQRIVDDPPAWDIVTTTTDTTSAAESIPAQGKITLRIIDGKLESLGADGGSSQNLRYAVRTETTYRCKVPFPPNNPCPKGDSNTQTRSFGIFQGYGVDATDPDSTFTSEPGRISATWRRVKETAQDFGPPIRVEERIQMSLFKRPKP